MIKKIVSGGQTGADRAGVNAAMEMGIEYGGWFPKGRMAENGKIPTLYAMVEAHISGYSSELPPKKKNYWHRWGLFKRRNLED